MIYKAFRSCGVCGNEYVKFLHNLKFELLEGINLPDCYNIVYCEDCGFVYADTRATQEDYDEFYKNHNIYENDASYSDIEKYKLIVDTIEENIPKTFSILDVGFANGELLRMLKERGYSKLHGLDPSESCVNKLKEKGYIAYYGSIFKNNIDKKFDLIILSHVLEHILDISLAMKKLRKILTVEGCLYIEVPDLLQYKENNAMPFNFMDLEHINHLCDRSLINLMESNGFIVNHCDVKKWPIGDNNFYPAVWAIGHKHGFDLLKYKNVLTYIENYINNCIEKKYKEIDELVESQEPIIVWGTGSFAQRLYEMSDLGKCNIKMYIDNNNTKIGTRFGGKEIHSPEDIKSGNRILLLSVYGKEDIKKQLKDMGLKNKTISIEI